MKPLSEALSTKKHLFFVETFLNIIEGSKLNKDNIISMLSKMEMEILKDLNTYLKDDKNYFPYESNNDDFLNKDNKQQIVQKISDYLLKFKI